jgi:ketosteroid isomerase-like protein
MPTTPTREDAQIRESMDAGAQALRAKDINAVMAHYAPDNVTVDLRPPMQVLGADAYRNNFEAWFASVQGPIDYEIRDLRVTTRVLTSRSVAMSLVSGVQGRPERTPITGYVSLWVSRR